MIARPLRPAAATIAAAAVLVVVGVAAVSTPVAGALAHLAPPPAAALRGTAVSGAVATTTLPPGYDLVSPGGKVSTFGGAGWYGGANSIDRKAPIVGIASTSDGKGYWLGSSNGGVFSYGAARFHGSAGAVRLKAPIVGIAAIPGGGGYWLVASDGGIFSFGRAHFHGSTGSLHLNAPIVAMAPTPDGRGYWLVAADGGIFSFGDASFHGSTGSMHLAAPIVGMAASPDGRGYWLVSQDGGVFSFGAVKYLGSLVAAGGGNSLAAVVGITATPDGHGYWMSTSTGKVFAFGDAPYRGNAKPAGLPTASITEAAAVKVPPPSPYPAHSLGYDINWPQCNGSSSSTVPLPGEPGHAPGANAYTVAVVGVDGWAVDSPNQCLHAEAQWAQRATGTGYATYDLYMLLNSPASTSTIDQDGPYGHCASESGAAVDNCYAYNYGWNAAVIARQYALSQGASSQVWWLDIENTSCSNSNFNGGTGAPWSCDTALNDLTLNAAVASLRRYGITVGVYCTAYQWAVIMGQGFVPSGPAIPIWIAGATWTSPPYPQGWDGVNYPAEATVETYCSDPSYRFAGGTPWLLQETPGNNNYPYDPDFSCGPEAFDAAADPVKAQAGLRPGGPLMPVQVARPPLPG